MTSYEFHKILFILKNAGLKAESEITESLQEVWFLYFSNVDYKIMEKAVFVFILENKFFPTISELNKYIERYSARPDRLPEPQELRIYLQDKNRKHLKFLERLIRIFGTNFNSIDYTEYILSNDFRFKEFKDAYKLELERFRMIQQDERINQISKKAIKLIGGNN